MRAARRTLSVLNGSETSLNGLHASLCVHILSIPPTELHIDLFQTPCGSMVSDKNSLTYQIPVQIKVFNPLNCTQRWSILHITLCVNSSSYTYSRAIPDCMSPLYRGNHVDWSLEGPVHVVRIKSETFTIETICLGAFITF